jgi:hypothetical protein
MYNACEITFQPKMFFTNGGKWFEVCSYLEGISVKSNFRVYENEYAVSHCRLTQESRVTRL